MALATDREVKFTEVGMKSFTKEYENAKKYQKRQNQERKFMWLKATQGVFSSNQRRDIQDIPVAEL